jgi:acyl dehydratase
MDGARLLRHPALTGRFEPVAELLHLEDFVDGREFDLGSRRISEEEIVAFGRAWDPLYLHVDPVAALEGPYGGLIASGRHSCVVFQRLLHDSVLVRAAAGGMAGADEVRWLVPVRPGDTLAGRARVVETVADTNGGVVVLDGELVNQHGEVSTVLRVRERIEKRPA